jgi:hypothetical protein
MNSSMVIYMVFLKANGFDNDLNSSNHLFWRKDLNTPVLFTMHLFLTLEVRYQVENGRDGID